MERKITYAAALSEATDQAMAADKNVFVCGLGVPDPKRIFGTTAGLLEKYGADRVFDIPCSENALTGVCVGAATMGLRPVLTHQRIDFALLSLDQIINSAAKWHYMFDGQLRAPIVIRMILGRGWGQGPQHSQHLQALFAHIPGLKVVMPTTPHDAKGMMIAAIEDDSPVIYLEHRWLHNITGPVPAESFREPIGKAKVVREGKDITLVGISYMVMEAFRASEFLARVGIDCEVIDLRTLKPWDTATVGASVRKTGNLLVADTGYVTCGMTSEIVAWAAQNEFKYLKTAPQRVGAPDCPVPTTPALAKYFYPRSSNLFEKVLEMFPGRVDQRVADTLIAELRKVEDERPSDVPDLKFAGPF